MYSRKVKFVVYVNVMLIGVNIVIKYGDQNGQNLFNKPFLWWLEQNLAMKGGHRFCICKTHSLQILVDDIVSSEDGVQNGSKQAFRWFSKQTCGMSWKQDIKIANCRGWHRVILELWCLKWRQKWLTNQFRHYIKQDTDNVFGTVFSRKPTRIIVEISNILFMQIWCLWISYLWPYIAIK